MLSDYSPRHVIGDAYKLILMPLLFYFFYSNISSKDNFYSILLFLSKLLIACGSVLIFLYSIGALEELRFNFLYSYIPFIYLLIKGNKNRSNIPIIAFTFLLCLVPLTKGIGSLVALLVFVIVLVLMSRYKIRFFVSLGLLSGVLSMILTSYIVYFDPRVLQKVLILFSDEADVLYVLEFIMAGRLTEIASVIFGNNLILGNGFGANLTPILLHESLFPWYQGLLISNSHSMHSVFGELTLRTGLLSFFLVFLFYIFLAKRSYDWKNQEGKIIFAISIMLIQEMIVGQSLSDAFIAPMFFLVYVLKFGSRKRSQSMTDNNQLKSSS
tara:strand:+ start:20772 stop:21749 length:978 start_codon:yes stop_codon:yes gene_type:complete